MNNKYFWTHNKRFNDFPTYFKNKFKGRVQKISIDAGFTCPNRDGSKGVGGCNYCNNTTFKPSYCNLDNSVAGQVEKGVAFFGKKYETMRFLAYFQAYSNTYAPIEILKELYEEALKHPKVIGLVIATRPDCLSDDVLDYLQELSKQYYVMVEFGVESVRNDTLKSINRGHTWEESVYAIEATAQRGIHNCAHMILGLPGENRPEIIEQSKIISELPIENLKLHQLQIIKKTKMAKQFTDNPNDFNLFSVEEYIDIAVEYLEYLNPRIIVERFVSSSPDDLLIAPRWGLKNFEFTAKLEKRLKEKDTWQGRLF
jgi:radical SAM protein (TIGR01212 family)